VEVKKQTWLAAIALLSAASPAAPAEVTLTEGTNFRVDVSPADGRLAMDLLQRLWILPARGGEAVSQPRLPGAVADPRWSPDGKKILFRAIDSGQGQLWILDPESGDSRRLSESDHYDQDAAWHPSGYKVVFVSGRGGSGLDLWEHDIDTGVERQLTNYPGNETQPAWSADGSMLAYVSHREGSWSITVRQNGIDTELTSANMPLSDPSWRPDNTLLMYKENTGNGISLQMAIMSDPPLLRTYSVGEDLFPGPVSWQNRNRFVYTADGAIKQKNFDARLPARLPFRIHIGSNPGSQSARHPQRRLSVTRAATLPIVVRAQRIFDGVGNTYLENQDIYIRDGRIVEVTPHKDWPGISVLDLDNVTVMPGLIDSYARLEDLPAKAAGPLLLSFGVTTLVAADKAHDLSGAVHEEPGVPGPRVLRAGLATDPVPKTLAEDLALVRIPGLATASRNELDRIRQWQESGLPLLVDSWQSAPMHHADLLLGIESLPRSPSGRLYQDAQVANGMAGSGVLSGMADGSTPGLESLLQSRQATWLRDVPGISTRFREPPTIDTPDTQVILASFPSGLPAGLALHAEIRAMEAAGLAPEKILRSAGSTAADALGYGADLGRIAEGALADLVIIDGDPLKSPATMINVIAVVRNGHFYSVAGLLDRVERLYGVE
jgi:hypothetical protein